MKGRRVVQKSGFITRDEKSTINLLFVEVTNPVKAYSKTTVQSLRTVKKYSANSFWCWSILINNLAKRWGMEFLTAFLKSIGVKISASQLHMQSSPFHGRVFAACSTCSWALGCSYSYDDICNEYRRLGRNKNKDKYSFEDRWIIHDVEVLKITGDF